MKIKKIITIIMITIIIIISNSCSCIVKKEKIRIGYLPIAECLPLYVAKEKGYFEKYGLEVELISESSGPIVIKELDAGAIDIGFTNIVTIIKQNNSGKSFMSIFGATYESINHINHAIISRSNEKIPYKNAIFGVNAHNNIEELMLFKFLKSNGIKIDSSTQSKIKEISFPQMLPSLSNKEIDYACIVEPSITIAKNDTLRCKFIGNHYPVSTNQKVLVATYASTLKKISSDPYVIKKFIQAMKEATDYINNGNNDSRSYILTYVKLPEHILNEISLSEFSSNIDQNALSEIIELMYNPEINVNQNFITNPSKKIEYKDLIYIAK